MVTTCGRHRNPRTKWGASLAAVLLVVASGQVSAQRNLNVTTPAVQSEQRIALVIGNSAYPSSRLRNPVNDAKAMADKLRALGFDVILRTDVNLRDMTRSFSQFGGKLVPGSVGLFYYAGHGMQVQGKNFLIPIDAEIETEASVRSEAVDVDQLLYQLGPARLSMVILDACRNNPFERRFRGAGGGLAQIDAPTGTMLAYATAPGKVASDGTGSNGLYTEALLNAIGMPGLKIEDVFKQVRINVIKASDGQQTPWESSSLTGEFYFTPDNKAAVADEKLKQSEKERADLTKALEDQRKQRDKDAELVKAEMEKLRAELQKIRAEAAQPAAPTLVDTVTTATKPLPNTPPEKPVQVAIVTPPPRPPESPVSPSNNGSGETTALMEKPISSAQPEKPVQVAIVTPPPPTSPTVAPAQPPQQVATFAPSSVMSAAANEWKDRISLLEQFRGQLALSKAMAILLDLNSDEELTLLLMHEGKLNKLPWQSAFAIGVDKEGNLVWGGAWQNRNLTYALETALEFCAGSVKSSCRVVMVNGEFKEPEFVAVAKQLGANSLATTREAYLRSLTVPPSESKAGIGVGMGGAASAMGFSSIR